MSGNASRTRGRSRELRYRDKLREDGWWCERIDSAADLDASRPGRKVLIQMKSTLTRYSHFPASDRARLAAEARAAGAEAVLVWWPRGVGIAKAEWVPEWQWPESLHLVA